MPVALATNDLEQEQAATVEFADESEPRVGADRRDIGLEWQIPAQIRPIDWIGRDEEVRHVLPLEEARRTRRRRRAEHDPGAEDERRGVGEERRILEIDRPPINDPGPPGDGGDGAVG